MKEDFKEENGKSLIAIENERLNIEYEEMIQNQKEELKLLEGNDN